jgi:protein TonB
MRVYTLVFSILVHAMAVAAVVIAPLFATTELPETHRSGTLVVPRPVTVADPDAHKEPARAVEPRSEVAAPVAAAPIVAPTGISDPPPDLSIGGDPSPVPLVWPGGNVDGGDPVPPPPARNEPPRHVGGVIRPPAKTVHVSPVYPSIARAAKVQGTVILEAVISATGRVEDVKVLRSVQLLDAAAIDAVRQWRFTPTFLNGEPIPVVMTVTVTFTLTPQ